MSLDFSIIIYYINNRRSLVMNETWKLNDNSPIIPQPDNVKMQLNKHQLAMLYRCLNIERNAYKSNFPYSILADKAGAGKTGVIISLIMADKILYGSTRNIIVVPQNIYTQWVNEINKFAGDSLRVKAFINYEDITELFYDSDILNEYDIFITTMLYYDTVIKSVEESGCNIKRIIYDEIDTVSSIIDSLESKDSLQDKFTGIVPKLAVKGSKNKIVWFISASFDRCIKDNEFKFKKYTIPLDKLSTIMCKCEDSFIDKYNFKLEEPEYINHECESIADIYFNYLSVEQLDSINSLSFQNIHNNHTNKISTNDIDSIINIVTYYNDSIKINDESLKSLKNKNKFKISDDINNQIDQLVKHNTFFTKILSSLHNVKCNNVLCEDLCKCIVNNVNSINITNYKVHTLDNIISNTNKITDKILIFSDFSGSFKVVSNILDKHSIKYTELNGGNIKDVDIAINKYKHCDTSVLMIDSASQGCGMNLEMTTCIIFLHKTSELLYNQIIGRAQRYGRSSRLKVITLLNENEKIV